MKHTCTAALILIACAAAVILTAMHTSTAAAYTPPTHGESAANSEPALVRVYAPLVLRPPTGLREQPTEQIQPAAANPALIVIVTPNPVSPPVEPASDPVPTCGQYSTPGPHPCPQPASENASPAPAPEPPQPGTRGQ